MDFGPRYEVQDDTKSSLADGNEDFRLMHEEDHTPIDMH